MDLIATGSYCEVWRGRMRKHSDSTDVLRVAIKKMLGTISGKLEAISVLSCPQLLLGKISVEVHSWHKSCFWHECHWPRPMSQHHHQYGIYLKQAFWINGGVNSHMWTLYVKFISVLKYIKLSLEWYSNYTVLIIHLSELMVHVLGGLSQKDIFFLFVLFFYFNYYRRRCL